MQGEVHTHAASSSGSFTACCPGSRASSGSGDACLQFFPFYAPFESQGDPLRPRLLHILHRERHHLPRSRAAQGLEDGVQFSSLSNNPPYIMSSAGTSGAVDKVYRQLSSLERVVNLS